MSGSCRSKGKYKKRNLITRHATYRRRNLLPDLPQKQPLSINNSQQQQPLKTAGKILYSYRSSAQHHGSQNIQNSSTLGISTAPISIIPRYNLRLLRKRKFNEMENEDEGTQQEKIIKHSRKKRRLNNYRQNTNREESPISNVSMDEDDGTEEKEDDNNKNFLEIINSNHFNNPNPLAEFELEMTKERRESRNWFKCRYGFGNGWEIIMEDNIFDGGAERRREAAKIFKQDLTGTVVKNSLCGGGSLLRVLRPSSKNGEKKIITAAALVYHSGSSQRSTKIELLAVDKNYRNRKLGEMMLRLIQSRMKGLASSCLKTSAANEALPFWEKPKYQFIRCNVSGLSTSQQCAEKFFQVTYLYWCGCPYKAEMQLAELFRNFC